MIINKYETHYNNQQGILFISVLGKKNGKTTRLWVDTSCEKLVRKHIWNVNSQGYGICTCHGLLIHRLLTDAKEGEVIDHKDHNTRNNMMRNIKVTTHSENMKNRKAHSNNRFSPPIAGVQWEGSSWKAELVKNGVTFSERGFKTMHEAICCRIRMEYELNGDTSPNYRHLLKKMPRELLIKWFPEIYSQYNEQAIGSKIFNAHYKNSFHKSWKKHVQGVRKAGVAM